MRSWVHPFVRHVCRTFGWPCKRINPNHRVQEGPVPARPLLIRIPQRIIGLLVVLLLALQMLILRELVVRRSRADRQEELAGLAPGNPKMKIARPTAAHPGRLWQSASAGAADRRAGADPSGGDTLAGATLYSGTAASLAVLL
ncbi:MAG: hypothetical protein MI924_37275 [Chloroflexales bacterium]|nr:hypothetical protein [Chloroflexales bacterium]